MSNKIGRTIEIIGGVLLIIETIWIISTGIPSYLYERRTRHLSFHFDMIDKEPTRELQEEVSHGYRVLFPYEFVNKNPYDVFHRITWMLIPEKAAAESDAPQQFWYHSIEKVAKETSIERSIRRLAGDTTCNDWLNNKRNFLLLTKVSVWVRLDESPKDEFCAYKTIYTDDGGFYWEPVPITKSVSQETTE